MNSVKCLIISMLLFFVGVENTVAGGKNELPNGRPFALLHEGMSVMESSMVDYQSQIDALAGRLSSLEDRVMTNETLIQTLLSENMELQGMIDSYSGDIDDLRSRIEHNLMLIEGLQGELEAIQREMDFKQNLISGNCPSGMALRAINKDGSVECTVTGGEGGTEGGGSAAGVTQVRVFRIFDVPPGASNFATTVTCPEGFILTGGGAQTLIDLKGSRPLTNDLAPTMDNFARTRTWAAIASNNTTIAWGLTASAVCLRFE